METLSPEARRLYTKTFDFRNKIHDAAYATGMISDEVYQNNLNRWYPRLYEDYVEWEKASKAAGMGPAAGTVAQKGLARFTPRKLDRSQAQALERILDPIAGIDEMVDAAQVIATHNYATGVSRSVVARSMDDIIDVVAEGDESRLAMLGVTPEKLDAIQKLIRAKTSMNAEVADDEIARLLGWRKGSDLFKGPMKNGLPDDILESYIDPIVADDVFKTVEFMQEAGALSKVYNGFLGFFRASKTAYNPATHVRNVFGAAVFHHLAVGGMPLALPKQGLKALTEGDTNVWYQRARDAGLLGESFDAEIREALEIAGTAGAKGRGKASAMDWFGNGTAKLFGEGTRKVTGKIEGAASKAERFYRGIDEAYRVDAWIKLSQKYEKGGLTAAEAQAKALSEVHKFIPTFAQHSDFTNAIRKAIPFASFTTESLRVWKNAMIEKPHLAFFWSNFADVLSEAGGAAAGLSSEDLEAAREALPHYMNNKKLLALPFRANGKVQFVDMSYLIPMANMVEGTQTGELFFSRS
jgi:hypothetical protein